MTATAECWTCRFFRHDNEVSFDEARRSHETGCTINGHCHRHGPVAAVPDGDDRVVNYGYWPAVLSDDWCGEHDAAVPNPEKRACTMSGATILPVLTGGHRYYRLINNEIGRR